MAVTVNVRTVRVGQIKHGDVIRFTIGNEKSDCRVSNWLQVETVSVLSYTTIVCFRNGVERRFPNEFTLVEIQELG